MTQDDSLGQLRQRIVANTLRLRREFIKRFDVLTASELAELPAAQIDAGVGSVERWLREKRIFSIRHAEHDSFPRFQFDLQGKPLPIIAELLSIFGLCEAFTDWDKALWFVAPNGWLDGPRPIDLMLSDPNLVKDAAKQEILPNIE